MKYDAIALIGRAASGIERKDGGTAFALFELADNIAKLMRGEVSVDDFNGAYSGADAAPFIIDGLTPSERKAGR